MSASQHLNSIFLPDTSNFFILHSIVILLRLALSNYIKFYEGMIKLY
jgi:hypothetical protein